MVDSNTETAVLDRVLAGQSGTQAGVGVYAVPLADYGMSCMTWDAAAEAVTNNIWEYNPFGEAGTSRGKAVTGVAVSTAPPTSICSYCLKHHARLARASCSPPRVYLGTR